MFKFLIPFKYLQFSRLKSKLEVYSVIWIYPLYLFVFTFLIYNEEIFPGIALFILILCAWMSIYEIGYMENDAITIKKEKEPNIRIEKKDIAFIQGNFNKIVALRVLILGIICYLIYFFGLLSLEKILFLCGYIGAGRLFFYLHNTIRSRWNIVTYFVLCVLKYYLVVWVFMAWDFGNEPYLIVLFSFPVLRTIEHSVKKKYELVGVQELVGSLDAFRAFYYSILLFVTSFGFFFLGFSINWVYSILYFFVFRFGIYALIKSGIYSRQMG